MNRKLKLSLYIAAIFAAGAITGIFITVLAVRHMLPTQERMVNGWCRDLQHRLDITPDQAKKIRPIIENTVAGFKENLSQDVLTRLSNSYERVALELTPEQKTKLEKYHRGQEAFLRSKLVTNAPPPGK
jgi:hypothetical protein